MKDVRLDGIEEVEFGVEHAIVVGAACGDCSIVVVVVGRAEETWGECLSESVQVEWKGTAGRSTVVTTAWAAETTGAAVVVAVRAKGTLTVSTSAAASASTSAESATATAVGTV